ncbi:Hsp20 family protein [Candidatus Bathyarchaeota archaeon]|nr:Hsp20 family protein [Candidatus Bathyarchaeota archaeon]
MKTFFNFDEIFGDLWFPKEFTEDTKQVFEEIQKMINSGKLKGKWDIEKIDEPGRKGYIARGQFWSDRPIDPFDPLRPWRRPTPQRRFPIARETEKEIREPLTDVFEKDEALKIYVELPGEEKESIELNVTEGEVEVKGRKFHKTIEIPTADIDIEKVSSGYKNGVLEITVPKKKKDARKVDIE